MADGAAPESRAAQERAAHRIVFRKSNGQLVVTQHPSLAAALETAREIRTAFPWVRLSIDPVGLDSSETPPRG